MNDLYGAKTEERISSRAWDKSATPETKDSRNPWLAGPISTGLEPSQTNSDAPMWCSGPESNRYAPITEAADFLHTTVFTASSGCSCAGLCLHRGACAVGAPRLVSTPSHCWAWLGVASACRPGVSPNLRGFTQVLSLPGAQFLSPLCLPIPPPEQTVGIVAAGLGLAGVRMNDKQ